MTRRCASGASEALQIHEQLDRIQPMVLDPSSSPHAVMEALARTMESARQRTPPDLWAEQARAMVTSHAVIHLVHQEPFTRRCFYKPRGYAGDARMLDYVYGDTEDDDSTALGRRLLEGAVDRPAPRAVRHRLDLLAAAIDEAAERRRDPRVLAVASGHLREATRSIAVREGRVREIVAFDQDARSLARVARDFAHQRVTAVQGQVRDLITGRRASQLGSFDLIYAAGLYDYLVDEAAWRLTRSLFTLLRPGGRLLIANFLPGIPDRGYMESFMDWRLVYRTLPEIERLLGAIPAGQIASSRTFVEAAGNIGFVEVTREAAPMTRSESIGRL